MVLSRAAARPTRTEARKRITDPIQRIERLEEDLDDSDRIHEMLLAKADGLQRTMTGILVGVILAVVGAALNLLFNAI